jgi:hypothetical protein
MLQQSTEIDRETIADNRYRDPVALRVAGLQPANAALRQNRQQPRVDKRTRDLLEPFAVMHDKALGHVFDLRFVIRAFRIVQQP